MTAPPPADARPLLLAELALDNFMLHRDTQVALDGHPVALITGANGSGKTQLLEALILALGHHPRRVKKGQLASLVGPFGDRATIRLTLNNPRWHGGRALRVDDEGLTQIADADRVTIETRIDPVAGLSHRLHGAGKRPRVIRQKQLRQLLESVSVKGDNRLAFTEEGTVNLFADHSGRGKFELILSTTGLLAYREQLLEGLALIDQSLSEVDPLKRKLHLEKDYLQTLEKNLELLRTKQQLEDRQLMLRVERAWADVRAHEEDLDADRRKVDAKKASRAQLLVRLRGLESEQAEAADEQRAAAEAVERLGAQLQELRRRRSALDGEVAARKRVLEQLEGRRERARERYAALEAAGPPIPDGAAALVEPSPEPPPSAGPLELSPLGTPAGRVEWRWLTGALALAEAAEAAGVALEGPVCCLLSVPAAREAGLRAALGQLAYALVARDDAALAAAAELLAKGDYAKVLRVEADDADAPAGLLARVKGDAALRGRLATLLASRFGAQATADDAVVGTRAAARAAVWRLAPLSAEVTPDQLREAAAVGQRRLAWLDARAAAEAARQRDELLAEIRRLHQAQLADVEAALAEVDAEAARLVRENSASAEERTALATQVAELETRRQTHRDELEALATEAERQGHEHGRRQGELENLERVLALYESDLVSKRRRLEDVEDEARRAGRRPDQIRMPATVDHELAKVATRLEELGVTRVNLSQYETQKTKVAEMERELSGSLEHLKAMRDDLKRKSDDWYGEVKTKIELISESVKDLLSGIFDGVQVRVENLSDVDKAAFEIDVKRRGRAWRELAQLSGGEKVLTVEALILSLHLLSDSPVHAIDEFTQRLDVENKAYALEMVIRTVEAAGAGATGPYRPQFLLLCPDLLGLELDAPLAAIFGRVVVSPARAASNRRQSVVRVG